MYAHPPDQTDTVAAQLVHETRRRLIGESLPRIAQCLNELTDEDIWLRPNEHVVSVGNLILHLCGNVRQWILSGLMGRDDRRDRDAEFATTGPIARADVLAQLESTRGEVDRALDEIDPEALNASRRVQGIDETGVSILVHVIEHFTYHTGQISLAVKLRKNMDLGYYAGRDLNAKG